MMHVLWEDSVMLPNRAERALPATRLAAVISAMWVLSACHTTPAPSPPASPGSGPIAAPMPAARGPGAAAAAHGTATHWQIDPVQTVVTIVVRRAGPLAKLGHDHVITSSD